MKTTKIKRSKYYRQGELRLSLGNMKIGEDTLILNMGDAKNCPSRRRGMCKLGKKCYALKAENMYPSVYKYRVAQKKYWLKNSSLKIWFDIRSVLMNNRRRIDGELRPLHESIKYLRFSESGDFFTQACVKKLDFIAWKLKSIYGITTYGYSARRDLDFSNIRFVVKGSGHYNGNNGFTIARSKAMIDFNLNHRGQYVGDSPDYKPYIAEVCPMDCSKCTLCKVKNSLNIVFPLH